MSSSGRLNFGPTSTRVSRVADLQRVHRGDEALGELVGDPLVHIHALVADADLAAILEARQHGGAHRRADVGVLGDDERRLAAELEAQQLEVVGGVAEHLLAGAHAAGQRDQARDRVAHQRRADALAGAADDVDDAGREIELERELRDLERRDRRALVRLDDDRVAGDQRRPDLAAHQRRRIVPGGQRDDDAVRDALDPDLLVGHVGGDDVAGDAARLLGGIGEVERGALDLAARLWSGLPCSATTMRAPAARGFRGSAARDRCSSWPREAGGIASQAGCASRAATRARSASSAPPFGTEAITASVAGFSTSIHSLTVESTHCAADEVAVAVDALHEFLHAGIAVSLTVAMKAPGPAGSPPFGQPERDLGT